MLWQRDMFQFRGSLKRSFGKDLNGDRKADGFQGGAIFEGTDVDGLQTGEETQFGEVAYQRVAREGRSEFGHRLCLIDGELPVAVDVPAVEANLLDDGVLEDDVVGHELLHFVPRVLEQSLGEGVFRNEHGGELRAVLQMLGADVDAGRHRLEDDGLQLGTVVEDVVADARHGGGEGEHGEGGVSEGVLADEADGVGQRDGFEVAAVAEGVGRYLGQSGEVAEFVERCDERVVGEDVSEAFHGLCLLGTEVAVVVGVPVADAELRHVRVFEVDELVVEHLHAYGHLGGFLFQPLCALPQTADDHERGGDGDECQDDGCQLAPSVVRGLVEVFLQRLGVRVSPVDGPETLVDDSSVGVPTELQFLKDDAERVDVVACVGCGGVGLFGRHVSHGSCGLLEDGVAVGVGESEVDDLHVAAVVRQHDVRGLQVAVYHLLLVDVGHGVDQFVGKPPPCGGVRLSVEEVGEGGAVYPFRNEARPCVSVGEAYRLHAVCLHDGVVLQGHEHLHLFPEQLLVGGVVEMLLFQAFQQEPPPVALRLEEVAIAIGVQRCDVGERTRHALVVGRDDS